jgi:prepilin-type processing-associated H-X9-DG protein
MRNPSTKLAFIDGIDWWVDWGDRGACYQNGWDQHHQQSIAAYRGQSPEGAALTPCWGPVLYRHNEGAMIGFYDGHAGYMKKQEVWIQDYFEAKPQKPGMWVADMCFYARSVPPKFPNYWDYCQGSHGRK